MPSRIPPPNVHVSLAKSAPLSTVLNVGATADATTTTALTITATVTAPVYRSTPAVPSVTSLRRPATPSTESTIATPSRPRLSTIQRRRTIASFADIEKHTWDVWSMYEDKENVDPRWLQDALRRSRGMSPGVKGKSSATGVEMKVPPSPSPARIRRIATAPDLSATTRASESRAVLLSTRTPVVTRHVPRPGAAVSTAADATGKPVPSSRTAEPDLQPPPVDARIINPPATPTATRLPVPSVCSTAARRAPATAVASISPCARRTMRPVSGSPAAVQPPRRPMTKSEAGTDAIPRRRRALSLTAVTPTTVVTSVVL
ncbi:hypothetical protein AMAG_07949 [Allomyces macrogynus ATCC 38327]|uniref:Uncharacterized protein n=1 Tax=Allomyces macrogynus (strain ATCC 38327) TaxID=578462 RepID=A0A0L0SK13_ALLM3|nr:hypothetical protein AMAG_07949 [Allomyces macrogynus ATCC 38327]|eukprot:KNE62764.1 hypothetical protein AMAG_07949 [Allomyces macrogynus ATCC 38327]